MTGQPSGCVGQILFRGQAPCPPPHCCRRCCNLYHTLLMSCGVIMKVGWMDKVVASFWPHFNVTVVENLFSSVNTANRPQLSLIEIQSVSSLLDNINGRYRPNRFLLHNISPKLLIYQLYFTNRGSQCHRRRQLVWHGAAHFYPPFSSPSLLFLPLLPFPFPYFPFHPSLPFPSS